MENGNKRIIEELNREKQRISALVALSNDVYFEYFIAQDKLEFLLDSRLVPEDSKVITDYSNSDFCRYMFLNEETRMLIAPLFRGGEKDIHVEFKARGFKGDTHWYQVTARTIFSEEGQPISVIGKSCRIDEQKEKEATLYKQSTEDSLTGLLNQMTARTMISDRIRNAQLGKESFLIICDIDNFKTINDDNGHMFGDAVLCFFAGVLKRTFPEAIKGRIGGDEFLVYTDSISREELTKRLDEVNASLADEYRNGTGRRMLSSSIGVAAFCGDVNEYELLFHWADYALYSVKSKGKAYHHICDVTCGSKHPDLSYLGGKPKEPETRRDELFIKNEEALAFFCVELLDNVRDIYSALKMIFDRTGSYYQIDDILCMQHLGDTMEILHQWDKGKDRSMGERIMDPAVYEWGNLNNAYVDEQGIYICEDISKLTGKDENTKSVMIVSSLGSKEYQYSIIFAVKNRVTDFTNEKEGLHRIANLIFKKLRQNQIEDMETSLREYRLNYDNMTGLPMYNHFVKLAEQTIRSRREKDLYFVYTDFSNFQYINEMYGYGAGDEILREYADWLTERCKGGIVFSRITADNFVGLFAAEDEKEAVDSYYQLTSEFCDYVNKEYELGNLVSATGIYHIDGTEKNMAVILDCANDARKNSKSQKAFCQVCLYNSQIQSENERRKSIMAGMLTAINNDEFHVYLQPKINVRTNKVVGAEALVRWFRQDGTMVSPADFIEIFESNGFITKMDFCVLDKTLEYLREAMDMGEEVVPISVNFSRRHNDHDNFVPSIGKRLARYKIPNELIEVEITESVFMSNLEKLNRNIDLLHSMGMRVLIDDFGSGYSSLNVLSSVTADVIKMDKAFLDYIDSQKSKDFIRHFVKLLRQMDLEVIAEGVETKEQLDMLKKAGCDVVQGYYYAKPMPVSKFREFLKEYNTKGK